MHWCDLCKVWMNDTKAAKLNHERGMKHQENLAKSRSHAGTAHAAIMLAPSADNATQHAHAGRYAHADAICTQRMHTRSPHACNARALQPAYPASTSARPPAYHAQLHHPFVDHPARCKLPSHQQRATLTSASLPPPPPLLQSCETWARRQSERSRWRLTPRWPW